jgi:hypothetical protein
MVEEDEKEMVLSASPKPTITSIVIASDQKMPRQNKSATADFSALSLPREEEV